MSLDSAALAAHRPLPAALRHIAIARCRPGRRRSAGNPAGGAAGQHYQSTLRTWLTGILKHKIVDLIRKQSREAPLAGNGSDDEQLDDFDALFDQRGHWTSARSAAKLAAARCCAGVAAVLARL